MGFGDGAFGVVLVSFGVHELKFGIMTMRGKL